MLDQLMWQFFITGVQTVEPADRMHMLNLSRSCSAWRTMHSTQKGESGL